MTPDIEKRHREILDETPYEEIIAKTLHTYRPEAVFKAMARARSEALQEAIDYCTRMEDAHTKKLDPSDIEEYKITMIIAGTYYAAALGLKRLKKGGA